MKKHDTAYKIISVINFFLHSLLFIFILYSSFLPFREGKNFYQVFIGFFSPKFGTIQPYFVLSLWIIVCALSFCTIRHPAFSVGVLLFSFSFFIIVVLPYSIESAIVDFCSPWIGLTISTYQSGYYCMSYASYVIYLDFAFMIYSFITLFIQSKN